MNNKILAELDFNVILNESAASTQTGFELLNRYKSFCMANEVSCGLVNNFIKEASNCRYDNGVNDVLEQVADYINCNKTVWALASACESINNNNKSYNYLNRNAAKQVEKLLEMQEEDVVKYIKAGALKNVMYCESFRNIAKQVYKDQPIVEANAEYVKITPVSIVENAGDGYWFEVLGNLYRINENKEIVECGWNEVSNTFKTVTSLLESNMTTIDEFTISVKIGNVEYQISESEKVVKVGKEGRVEMTVEQLRDNNRLMLTATNPRRRNEMAGVLEAIALTCENYDNIVSMDNVAIYSTKTDKFIVIESGENLYSTLIQSSKYPKWTINEDAIEALSFIKSKTNVSLNDVYEANVRENINNVSEEDQKLLESELKNQEITSYKERIELLTEKFKDDPVKLAVLSKLAQQIQEL